MECWGGQEGLSDIGGPKPDAAHANNIGEHDLRCPRATILYRSDRITGLASAVGGNRSDR